MKGSGVIVLGALGGLGREIHEIAKQRGEIVCAFDLHSDAERNVVGFDLADEKAGQDALRQIPFDQCSHWIVVAASGVYDGNSNGGLVWAKTRHSLEVNLVGVCAFLLGVVERLNGCTARLVVVTSAAARVGSGDIGYGVAKAGLEGLVRSISKNCAASGITAIGVAPGLFASPMSASQTQSRKEAAIAATHIRRPLELREITAVTAYAAFEAPDALTGTFLSPSGGQVCL
jgi:3-oxoacyl-[acyl-carrier protein] reductase